MKYILEDFKLRKVADGKQNAGTLFIQATVYNPEDLWDEPGTMTTFNERMVAKLEEYLAPSVLSDKKDSFGREVWLPSQLKDQSKPIPEAFTVFDHGEWVEVPSPGGQLMVRIGSDMQPLINPKNNQFYYTSSIMVLTKKSIDTNTGKAVWARGWSPEQQAKSIWNNLYAPASKFEANSGGVILPMSPDTPLINGETAEAGEATV